ncbi:glycoside hydrolase family 38 protein, partial [Piromyces sp. E2]
YIEDNDIDNSVFQLFNINKEKNVIIDTIKYAENESVANKAIVVRLYEAYGGTTQFKLHCPLPIKKCYICNGLEDTLYEVEWRDNSCNLTIKPFKCLIYFITVGLRNLAVTASVSTIPANYIPIEPVDIPKKTYDMINCEINKALEISSAAIPLQEDIPSRGWGTMYENVHFQTAIRYASKCNYSADGIDVDASSGNINQLFTEYAKKYRNQIITPGNTRVGCDINKCQNNKKLIMVCKYGDGSTTSSSNQSKTSTVVKTTTTVSSSKTNEPA